MVGGVLRSAGTLHAREVRRARTSSTCARYAHELDLSSVDGHGPPVVNRSVGHRTSPGVLWCRACAPCAPLRASLPPVDSPIRLSDTSSSSASDTFPKRGGQLAETRICRAIRKEGGTHTRNEYTMHSKMAHTPRIQLTPTDWPIPEWAAASVRHSAVRAPSPRHSPSPTPRLASSKQHAHLNELPGRRASVNERGRVRRTKSREGEFEHV